MKTWTDEDWDTLVAHAAAQVPPIDPGDVAIVLYEESGLDPANPGPPASATNQVAGLNQMSTPNLQSLGLTRALWLGMTPAEQLPWIFRFWQSLARTFNGGRFPSDAGELVALNFLPGAFEQAGAGTNADAVIAAKAGPFAWAYNDNPPLQNPSGTITVNTLRAYLGHVATSAGAAWQTVMGHIAAAVARAGGGSSPALPSASSSSPPSSGKSGALVALLLLAGITYFAVRRNA